MLTEQSVDVDEFAVRVKAGQVTVSPLSGLVLGLSITVPAKFSLLVRFTEMNALGPPRVRLPGIVMEIVKSPTCVKPSAEWDVVPIMLVPVTVTK